MNWTVTKIYAILAIAGLGTFSFQRAVVPRIDDAMNAVRSEITNEALAERIGAPTTRASAPETRSEPETQPVRRAPFRSTHRPQTMGERPPRTIQRASVPLPVLPWPWFSLLARRPVTEYNIAIEDAVASPYQVAPAVSALARAADPISAIGGEMTCEFPVVRG